MIETKLNIREEKEIAIYKAALDEFSEKGYENASTNNIVKNAGISKGALFKYFGTKSKLFIYVISKAIETLDENTLGHLDNLSSDMFERITYLTKVKTEVSLKYKKESSVLVSALSIEDEGVKRYISVKVAYYYKIFEKILTEGIDYSKFRDDVDCYKVCEILVFISEGLQKKYLAQFHGSFQEMTDNVDKMSKEIGGYINFIRDSAYIK